MNLTRYYIVLFTFLSIPALAQNNINGKVIDKVTGFPLSGATLRLSMDNHVAKTNSKGNFMIKLSKLNDTIVASFVGYITKKVLAESFLQRNLQIELEPNAANLEGVTISTGYYNIPKERSTGSFTKIDSKQLNQSVTTDLLGRLKGISNSLSFDERLSGSGITNISVRGTSTLFAETQPLIVLNNFPFNGDLNSINPNDVESVTILKDAAAASIWGVRAANGVIVINTKKGTFNQPTQISVNANTTIGRKPDLFYRKSISSSDFIDLEQYLFNNGFYNGMETDDSNPPLTPVVELLMAARDGKISASDADTKINQLKKYDVRNDFEKYWYKNSLNQQYILNFNGGTEKSTWYYSAGFDRNNSSTDDKYQRISLRVNNSYKLSETLKLNPAISFVQSKTTEGRPEMTEIRSGSTEQLYPYARLADENGNALPIVKDYRTSFIQNAESLKLLNWQYSPLEDVNESSNITNQNELMLNMDASYSLSKNLNVTALYQYERTWNENRTLYNSNSYYARNLINQFTQAEGATLFLPVPKGAITDLTSGDLSAQSGRAQIEYNNNSNKNSFSAIGGVELRSIHSTGNIYRTYGYDQSGLISAPVDYITKYPLFNSPGTQAAVDYVNDFTDKTNRYTSVYVNGSYTYNGKYLLSISARKDASNLFGVDKNQKGIPLWSAGAGWNIYKEDFFRNDAVDYLKLRITYGYNGNLSRNLSALATIIQSGNNLNNVPYANVKTYPNPELSWEKVRVVNLGIDFGIKNKTITGSVEFYSKNSRDLIGDIPVDPTIGVLSGKIQKNIASMKNHGIDIQLNSQNSKGRWQWQSAILLNYNRSKITSYYTDPNATASSYINAGLGISPVIGKPTQSIFTYQWAGLDANTGDPIGIYQNEKSKAYGDIVYSSKLNDLVYNGPAQPTIFGAVANTIIYKGFSLYLNITYRLGYYFQRSSISYNSLYNSWSGHGDYAYRWQKSGDEQHTSIPSRIYPADPSRDDFYNNSATLVERADNIRLQDLNLSYSIKNNRLKSFLLKDLTIYIYGRNVGMIWKANKSGIDPDYLGYLPSVSTLSFGIKANL